MSVESIIHLTISSNSSGVTRKSFGIPLIYGKHDAFASKTREYASNGGLAQLVTDGIPATHPIYIAAQSALFANPKIDKFIVGKAAGTFSQLGTITVVPANADIHEGDEFSLTVVNASGVGTAVSHTAAAGHLTAAEVAADLASKIAALTGIAATAAQGVVSWEVDADDEVWRFTGIDRTKLAFKDNTVAPTDVTLADDFASISISNDSWYGLVNALPQSGLINAALAPIIEAQEKVFFGLTHDTEVLDGDEDADIMSTLKAGNYFRTAMLYSGDQAHHAASAWMGEGFPWDPGSSTWAYKVLAGITVDRLTEGEASAVVSDHTNTNKKNGNVFIPLGGKNVTNNGKTSGGEWIDIVIGRDWQAAEMRQDLWALLTGARKVPYTDNGIELVKRDVKGALTKGVNRSVLSDDKADEPWVTAPKVSETSVADRQVRKLPSVKFGARLAGAIHATDLNGVFEI